MNDEIIATYGGELMDLKLDLRERGMYKPAVAAVACLVLVLVTTVAAPALLVPPSFSTRRLDLRPTAVQNDVVMLPDSIRHAPSTSLLFNLEPEPAPPAFARAESSMSIRADHPGLVLLCSFGSAEDGVSALLDSGVGMDQKVAGGGERVGGRGEWDRSGLNKGAST